MLDKEINPVRTEPSRCQRPVFTQLLAHVLDSRSHLLKADAVVAANHGEQVQLAYVDE